LIQNAMSKIYLEILDKQRQGTLKKLKEFALLGYLGGGTALALQIGHRVSLDFDFFVDKPPKRRILKKCREIFGEGIKVIVQSDDQVTIVTPENIKLDFVYYWYPLISPPIKLKWVNLASVFDIAADKAATIGRRAVWRDYVDIFFLLKGKFLSLERLISLAKKKFGGEFNEVLFLEQLVFFKDLEVTKMEFLKETPSADKIKQYLENEVKRYLKKHLAQ